VSLTGDAAATRNVAEACRIYYKKAMWQAGWAAPSLALL
jgi:hypothetical protein